MTFVSSFPIFIKSKPIKEKEQGNVGNLKGYKGYALYCASIFHPLILTGFFAYTGNIHYLCEIIKINYEQYTYT